MPFKIKMGGAEIETAPPIPEVKLGHLSFLAWESYCRLCNSRDRAVALWEKHQALGAEIDERGMKHPKIGGALNKLHELEDAVVEAQATFLAEERMLNDIWRMMARRDRDEEGVSGTLGISSGRTHLWGLWQRPFALCDPPPEDCHIHSVALLACPPEQRDVYHTMRKGGDTNEES